MALYKNAFYWLIALLAVLVLGFWQSYFTKIGEAHFTHHFHAIAMLGWMLLLITQSWLIRSRQNARHRALGKLSFLVAPAVVVSALIVAFYGHVTSEHPEAPISLSFLWLGLISAAVFALMYWLAIRHRKNMQFHARYMLATALVFLVPGLARTVFQYLGPTGIWIPTFYQMLAIPLLIGLWLMFLDWKKKQTMQPFLVFSIAWAITLVLWKVLPNVAWWQAFGAWSVENLG